MLVGDSTPHHPRVDRLDMSIVVCGRLVRVCRMSIAQTDAADAVPTGSRIPHHYRYPSTGVEVCFASLIPSDYVGELRTLSLGSCCCFVARPTKRRPMIITDAMACVLRTQWFRTAHAAIVHQMQRLHENRLHVERRTNTTTKKTNNGSWLRSRPPDASAAVDSVRGH